MEEMDEVRPVDAVAIHRANFDLSDRVESEGITLAYNPEADVLVITIGKPQPAITEPLFDDIMYRINPDSLKIVGIEIVAFFSDFVRRNKLARKLLRGYIKQLLETKAEVLMTSPDDRALVSELLATVGT